MQVVNVFSNEFKFYYILSLLTFVVIGFMKTLNGREPWLMLFIIIPGLYFSEQAEN